MKVFNVKAKLFCTMFIFFAGASLAAENYPFPQNINYKGINPSNQTTSQQNAAVKKFYDHWKAKYLKKANTGGYFVNGPDTDGIYKGTSESHGYGMIITALMAGYDPDAKAEFDGLYDFFDRHRSQINNELMYWAVKYDEAPGNNTSASSATDGDMDIAYGLLLADKQWGSAGVINYRQEAIDMINKGIRVSDYNGTSRRLMLGDWDTKPLTSRSSDWMPGHLRAFAEVTKDTEWLSAIDEIFIMVDAINQINNSTGLMPDFVTGDPAKPDVANDNGTGEKHSGDYYYNAARTPLRLAMDYIHNNNQLAKNASNILIAWAKKQVGSSYDFNKYYSGYTITGDMLAQSQYSSTVFIAPVVVAASVDPGNQAFVNAGWNYIKQIPSAAYYYNDTINLLSMLVLTGNWWAPNVVDTGGNTIPSAIDKSAVTQQDKVVTVSLSGTDSDGTIADYAIKEHPLHGAVSLVSHQATYTPGMNYIGADSFSYTVTDNDGNVSAPAHVSITVEGDIVTPELSCTVVKENVWDSGFTADLKVTNTSQKTITGWEVIVSLGAGEQFSSGWSATWSNMNGILKASHLSWNKVLAPGGFATLGFQGSYTGNHAPVTCK